MTRETRNLQPDFSELKEDIFAYKNMLQTQVPILESRQARLDSLVGLIFILFLGTWIIVGILFWVAIAKNKKNKVEVPIVSFHREMSPDRISFQTSLPALNCNIERTLSGLLYETPQEQMRQTLPLGHGIVNPGFSIYMDKEMNKSQFGRPERTKNESFIWKTEENQFTNCDISQPSTSGGVNIV